MKLHSAFVIGAGLVALGLATAAAFAPYLFVEYSVLTDRHAIIVPKPVKIARGRMVDDYWSVEKIAPDTWAIGEPR